MGILEKREQFLEKKIEIQVAEARKCLGAKNRRGALTAIKRKKMYEGQVVQISVARDKIDQQIIMIEGATTSLETISALKEGAEAMQQIHQHMTVEQVDKTIDSIREQMDVATEINAAISQPLGGEVIDDEEITTELEELEEHGMSEQLLDLPKAEPVIPQAEDLPTPVKNEEEEELASLESAMAI